jgi:hypothetical protein
MIIYDENTRNRIFDLSCAFFALSRPSATLFRKRERESALSIPTGKGE